MRIKLQLIATSPSADDTVLAQIASDNHDSSGLDQRIVLAYVKDNNPFRSMRCTMNEVDGRIFCKADIALLTPGVIREMSLLFLRALRQI